jgi:hypothetical protein
MKRDNNYGVEVTTEDLIETLERIDKLAKQFEDVTPALLMVIPYITADIETKILRASFYKKIINHLTGVVVISAVTWIGHIVLDLVYPLIILKIKQYLGGL